MSDPAQDRLDAKSVELLERQLAERVAERVERSLLRRFTWIGGIVVAVLGYFGYDLVRDIPATAQHAASSAAQGIVETKVAPVAEQARRTLDDAQTQVQRSRVQLDILDEVLARNQRKAEDAAQRASQTAEQVKSTLATLGDQTDSVRRRVDEVSRTAEDLSTALRDSARDLATLRGINEDLEALTRQVAALDERLRDIANATKVDVKPLSDVTQSLGEIAAAASSRGEQYATPASNLVYFQFADLSQEQVRRIAAALRKFGYVVPGSERVGSAASLREVRYFYGEDAEAARSLARAAGQAIADLGFADASVVAKDLTGFKRAKPKPGILELWLGGPGQSGG